MKPKTVTLFVSFILFTLPPPSAGAQVLKKLGDRLKERIGNRAGQKADEAMDKGLDQAEKEVDGALDGPSRMEISGDGGSYAADCGNYYYLADDAEVQMTAYNPKGDPEIIITYRISDVKPIPGGRQSTVESELTDPKGKTIASAAGAFKCENGDLSVDMQVAMPSASMEQFKGMELKSDRAYLPYPGRMSAGQQLPGGAFHMDIYQNGRPFATVDYTVDNRKVEGKEQVTTPAGSWNCFRITYDLNMKVKIGIGIPMHYQAVEWFAPGFGVVKSEQYGSKKGKLSGSAQLTLIKRPDQPAILSQ